MYRVQIKTSWRWLPYKRNGEQVRFASRAMAEKVAAKLQTERGYPTRVVEVGE